MKTLKAKILKAELIEDGQVIITVKMTDKKGFSWFKNYSYFTTQKIKLDAFKNRIKSDVAKDLQATSQLEELKPAVGKEFVIKL